MEKVKDSPTGPEGHESAPNNEEIAQIVDQTIQDEQNRLNAIMATSAKIKFKIEVNGERWFTYQQMCSILKCHRSTVFNFAKSGKIEVMQVDSTTLYRLHKDYM